MIKLVLALDLKAGMVVLGRSGLRNQYLPVNMISNLVDTCEPISLLSQLHPARIYIADLDGISGKPRQLELISRIRSAGSWLTWLDLGVSSLDELELSAELSHHPILATETAGLELIAQAHELMDFCLGIDLIRDGLLLKGKPQPIQALDPISNLGWDQLLILDLSRVGTGLGPDLKLISELDRLLDPNQLLVGGGIGKLEHLDQLEELGVDKALISTGIHLGWIPAQLLRI